MTIDVSQIKNSPKGMKKPVGYLSFDGKWFLVESEVSGLVHLELSDYVYNQYEKYIKDNHIYISHPDNGLCHAGFIKVHGYDVRYFAKLPFSGYYNQKDCKTPEVNDLQIQCLVEYGKEHGYQGRLWINNHPVSVFDLAQMDKIQRNKTFNILRR